MNIPEQEKVENRLLNEKWAPLLDDWAAAILEVETFSLTDFQCLPLFLRRKLAQRNDFTETIFSSITELTETIARVANGSGEEHLASIKTSTRRTLNGYFFNVFHQAVVKENANFSFVMDIPLNVGGRLKGRLTADTINDLTVRIAINLFISLKPQTVKVASLKLFNEARNRLSNGLDREHGVFLSIYDADPQGLLPISAMLAKAALVEDYQKRQRKAGKESDPTLTNIVAQISPQTDWGPESPLFTGEVFSNLCKVAAKTDNNVEASIAIKLLARLAQNEPSGNRLVEAFENVKNDPQKRFLFFSYFKDPVTQMLSLLSAGTAAKNFTYQVTKDELHLNSTYYWKILDTDVCSIYYNRFAADRSSKAIANELANVATETFPNPQTLWDEIQDRRSITLSETQEIDLKNHLPASWHVFISPKANGEAYSMTIRIVERIDAGFKHVEVKGKLDRTGFSAGIAITEDLKAKIYHIGSIAVHRYFVREMEETVRTRVLKKTEEIVTDAPGESMPLTEQPIEPANPSHPVKGGRTNNSLTVDLTEKDKNEDKERQMKTQIRITHSNQTLRKYLKGLELTTEETNGLMLFTQQEGFTSGKAVYKLIKDPEQKTALLKDGLANKNLWVMVGSPHSRAAGFQLHHFWEHPLENTDPPEEPRILAYNGISRKAKTEDADWAYLNYLENGFDPMGEHELNPYESILGIKVEATEEIRNLMKNIAFAQYAAKEAAPVMERNFIEGDVPGTHGIATLHLGGMQSNRTFNQGAFIRLEEFARQQETT